MASNMESLKKWHFWYLIEKYKDKPKNETPQEDWIYWCIRILIGSAIWLALVIGADKIIKYFLYGI